LIKINLVREGRAVRGAGAGAAAPVAAAAGAGPAAPPNMNMLIIAGLAVVAIVIMAGYWFVNNRALANRQETLVARKTEADKLEAIIKEVEEFQRRKDSLQNRIDLINQLKQNQKGPVRIMDQISRDLPDLVWLDKMTITGGHITINGRGLNPNAIANFVENIKNDPYFEEPEPGLVSQVTAVPLVYSFDMGFNFTYTPKTPGAAPGAPGSTATTGTTGTAKTSTTTTRAAGAPAR
jgi:type IV pilus assembly protein PilN